MAARPSMRSPNAAIAVAVRTLLLALLAASCTASSPPLTATSAPKTTAQALPTEPSATLTAPTTTTPTVTVPPTTTVATVVPPNDVPPTTTAIEIARPVVTGATSLATSDFAALTGKRVGIIVNQTSVLADGTHLIDALHQHEQIELAVIFAPEHGVRGSADAGELVDDAIDENTLVPIRSLYGTQRTPAGADLAELDALVYDLQDAGTRFYTFISTMGLAMAAADDAGVEFVVLDRPNPLGGTLVSGFDRTSDQASFISQYPIPAVYGMTAGELALMIAGEGWVEDEVLTRPTVLPLLNWNREPLASTDPWIAPSPGLPTIDAVRTYPGTVFFEATSLSYGKGTNLPFSMVGAPDLDADSLIAELTSRQLPGVEFSAITVAPDSAVAPNPRFDGIEFRATQITVTDPSGYRPVATGVHLLAAIRDQTGSTRFIDRAPTFDLLAGTTQMLTMLDDGATADEIVAAWEAEAAAFALRREPYLLY